MSLITILNVVIGLIFTWLVLSLATIYIQEWLAARLRWRSKMLDSTVRNMLTDSALADQFYDHPLIRSLHSGKNGACKPSYIPSDQFALALLDIVMTAGTEAGLFQQQLYRLNCEINTLNKRQRQAAQKRLNLILNLAGQALVCEAGDSAVNAILETACLELKRFADNFPRLKTSVEIALNSVETQKKQIEAALCEAQSQMGGYRDVSTFMKIRRGVIGLSVTHPRLKQTLQMLFSGVEEYTYQGRNVLERARQNLEEWFDSSMDRLSGWYKRRAQVLTLTIGTLLALIANVDSLLLANQLWRDQMLRDTLVNQAEAFLYQNQDDIQSTTAEQLFFLQNLFAEINLPLGWIGTPIILDDTARACTLFPQTLDDIYGQSVASQCYQIVNAPRLNDLPGWILKVIGLAATGLATAQGAPFWFDILKKFINVRVAGSNPSETQRGVG